MFGSFIRIEILIEQHLQTIGILVEISVALGIVTRFIVELWNIHQLVLSQISNYWSLLHILHHLNKVFVILLIQGHHFNWFQSLDHGSEIVDLSLWIFEAAEVEVQYADVVENEAKSWASPAVHKDVSVVETLSDVLVLLHYLFCQHVVVILHYLIILDFGLALSS